MTERSRWIAYADGASRGNPGPASIGAVLYDDNGREVHTVSRRIGWATNNEAEYQAAIAALEAAHALGVGDLELRMDSELVVRQLDGRYKVRKPSLQRLFGLVKDLQWRFDSFGARHVRRELNKRADELANLALDS